MNLSPIKSLIPNGVGVRFLYLICVALKLWPMWLAFMSLEPHVYKMWSKNMKAFKLTCTWRLLKKKYVWCFNCSKPVTWIMKKERSALLFKGMSYTNSALAHSQCFQTCVCDLDTNLKYSLKLPKGLRFGIRLPGWQVIQSSGWG